MKKIFVVLFVGVILISVAVIAKGPIKEFYTGKLAGNSGFTNIVEDNFPYEVTGWIRYNKESKALHTTWVINGLVPNEEYQLKLNSKCGDTRLTDFDYCETGEIWKCGKWGSETFLVMDTVQANKNGRIGVSIKEDRLKSGAYQDMQFIVTMNSEPWGSAWTWENSEDTDKDECINDYGSDISAFAIK